MDPKPISNDQVGSGIFAHTKFSDATTGIPWISAVSISSRFSAVLRAQKLDTVDLLP